MFMVKKLALSLLLHESSGTTDDVILTGGWRRVQGGWSSCSNPVRLATREQDSTGNTSSGLQNKTIRFTLKNN